jgi:hypothetical protein
MAIEIVYEVEDRSGTMGSTSVRVAGTPTVVQLNGFGAGFATALNNIIGGVIRAAAAFFRADVSGITGNVASSASDVEHIAKFEFLTTGGNRMKVNVPAMDSNIIGGIGSDTLDQLNPQVAAFTAAMINGINVTGAVIQPCDIGEDSLTDVIFAREAFRNSGARR